MRFAPRWRVLWADESTVNDLKVSALGDYDIVIASRSYQARVLEYHIHKNKINGVVGRVPHVETIFEILNTGRGD